MSPSSILIVEDEAIVALDLKMQLQELGYRVVGLAESAEQAFDLAQRNPPDLVLMDIMLRGTVDGISAAQWLQRDRAVPVVFLTSFSDAETVRRAAQTGAYGYLTKPFQIKELAAGIEVALYKSRMEQQLRESDRWFASTLRCVSDGVVVTHLDASIRFMNPAAEALTGWTMGEAMGLPLARVVQFADTAAGDALGPTAEPLHHGRISGIDHARTLQPRDAAALAVDRSAGPIDDEAGMRMGAVLVLRDARERLRQEARLRASEERFRSTFDLAPLGMALIAFDGTVLLVNDAFCRLLGQTAADLLGRSHATLTHADDALHETQRLRALLSGTGRLVQFEKRYVRAESADPLWTLVSVSLLHDENEPTCYLYQVHDLTQQKQAAEQLAELTAERMRREASESASRIRSEFLSRVSHEMRTPLNAVLGFGQLLQLNEGSGTVKRYADHIVGAGKHLLSMVDDVLDIQRVEQGGLALHLEPVALTEAVQAAVDFLQPLAAAQQITVEVEMPTAATVQADPKRLRQVLLNVGSNAVKYNRVGGTIRWSIVRVSGECLHLTVTDEGIGMTAEQQAKLFQPFERLGREATNIPGTGLGLLISRELMMRMGGSLHVTSAPREGTTVVLEFLGC